jgi:hypothetical protein
MKEMLTIGLEGMYDPDTIPGSSALNEGEDEDQGGMEWLLIHGNEGRSEDTKPFGLGLGAGFDSSLGANKGRITGKGEDDGSRMEEIRLLMREKQSQVRRFISFIPATKCLITYLP